MSERYSNRRMMFRRGGRFARAPSLESMGWRTCSNPECRRLLEPTPGEVGPKPVTTCQHCGSPVEVSGG